MCLGCWVRLEEAEKEADSVKEYIEKAEISGIDLSQARECYNYALETLKKTRGLLLRGEEAVPQLEDAMLKIEGVKHIISRQAVLTLAGYLLSIIKKEISPFIFMKTFWLCIKLGILPTCNLIKEIRLTWGPGVCTLNETLATDIMRMETKIFKEQKGIFKEQESTFSLQPGFEKEFEKYDNIFRMRNEILKVYDFVSKVYKEYGFKKTHEFFNVLADMFSMIELPLLCNPSSVKSVNPTDLLLNNEQLIKASVLLMALKTQEELKKFLAEIFSVFQDEAAYKILQTFLKHGQISKSKLGELLAGDHTTLFRGPLCQSFNKLLSKEIIVEVKRNKRGAIYDVAPKYKPIIEFLIKSS